MNQLRLLERRASKTQNQYNTIALHETTYLQNQPCQNLVPLNSIMLQ